MKEEKTSLDFTVDNLVTALTEHVVTCQQNALATMSNAQKNWQLTSWCRTELLESRLIDFQETVEKAIRQLPAGTFEVEVFNTSTGKKMKKQVKYRDTAKKNIVAAFKNAIDHDKLADTYKGKRLQFKLCFPQLKNVAAKPAIEDRLANLLGDTIDGKGLQRVVDLVEKEQKRHGAEVVETADKFNNGMKKAELIERMTKLKLTGLSAERAQELLPELTGWSAQEITKILAS